MGIFKRITDIISANMQEMVSQAENPERLLKQAVSEMESSIEEARQSTASALANEKVLRKRLADQEAQGEQWSKRAEEAVGKGNDDDARAALARKQEHVKISAALSDELGASSESAQTLRRQLEAMQAKLAEARRSLATLTARHRAAQVRRDTVAPQVKSDAFDKFDRMSEKVQMAEAEADAMRELTGQTTPTLDEPRTDPHAASSDVEAELAELKKKARK